MKGLKDIEKDVMKSDTDNIIKGIIRKETNNMNSDTKKLLKDLL